MRDLFGLRPEELDLETLRAALSEAESEPLLWEAKGGGSPPSAREEDDQMGRAEMVGPRRLLAQMVDRGSN